MELVLAVVAVIAIAAGTGRGVSATRRVYRERMAPRSGGLDLDSTYGPWTRHRAAPPARSTSHE